MRENMNEETAMLETYAASCNCGAIRVEPHGQPLRSASAIAPHAGRRAAHRSQQAGIWRARDVTVRGDTAAVA